MKRSEINKIMRNAVQFLEEQKFYLPKFAFWSVEEWKTKGEEIDEILKNQLGWDITDFGRGDFSKFGLILFTIRNGNLDALGKGGKAYCEKAMILEEEQITPMHFHFQKAEDIINRGGGKLLIELYSSTKEGELGDAPVTVSMDGIEKTLESGTIVTLTPGESITLVPNMYHKFWVEKGTGKVLIGEVSGVNDDRVDNRFHKEIGRFADIEEDEDPLYLLYDDYKKYL